MLDLFLPRTTRIFARVVALGIDQSLRTIRATRRPVYQSLHTAEELVEFTRRARAGTPLQREVDWAASVRQITRSRRGVSLLLTRPKGFEFAAGQFVTVAVTIDGRPYRRQYSICTDPDDREKLGLAIRRVDGGLVSNHLADHLAEGATVAFDGPSGRFTLDACQGSGRLVLIAGGVGVTPLLSIAHAAARGARPVTLIAANRGVTSIPLRRELAELESHELVQLHHVLERPSRSVDATVGRLDAATLDQLVGDDDHADYFVCGPSLMMDTVTAELRRRGVGSERIHTERFLTARERDPTDVGDRTHAVRFTRSGRLVNIPEGQTILEGARAAGVELPFSCTMGGCAACKVRVRGDVHLPDPNCLTELEAAGGETLACIACPRSSLTIDA